MMLCKKTKRPIINAINEFIDVQLYGDSENKKYIKGIMGSEASNTEDRIKTLYQTKIQEIYTKIKDNNAKTNNTIRTENI